MAQLFVFFVIGAALISGTNAQNILNTFSSLFGTSRLKFGGGGGGDDIFKQFLDNPNQLSALLGGRSGGLNFDSILKTFQPPAGGDEQSLPDIATLLKNGLTDVVGIAGGNQSRVNGTTANSSRSRPTLSSAESESEGIPIEGGFEPRRRGEERKLTAFSSDSIPVEAINDPAYLLLNDNRQPTPVKISEDDNFALEQILKAIEDSNF